MEPHWAYVAPKRPAVAGGRRTSPGATNPIDRFVLARLEKEGLTPSPEAAEAHADPPAHPRPDRPAADARRRSTRSSTTAAPDAYEQAGRPAARLAALRRAAWPGTGSTPPATPTQRLPGGRRRGPCGRGATGSVAAFNANMPFDQFTVEQIAGDLLPGATTEQKVATGFHRNHMINGEGGRIAEEKRDRLRDGPGRDDRDRLARADARLRPLPRPQVRPDRPEGVLPALRLLQQRRRVAGPWTARAEPVANADPVLRAADAGNKRRPRRRYADAPRGRATGRGGRPRRRPRTTCAGPRGRACCEARRSCRRRPCGRSPAFAGARAGLWRRASEGAG